MRLLIKYFPTLILLTCALFITEARADSIVITGGSATSSSFAGGPFTLAGNGIIVNGALFQGVHTCSPCAAGQPISLTNLNFGYDFLPGPAFVNGVSYSQLYFSGSLRFDAGFVVPTETASLITLTAPFELSGSLEGCTTDWIIAPCKPENLVFSTLLTGQGLASVVLLSYDSPTGRLYQLRSITYNFARTSSVPEPAALILFGSGIAGAAAALRKKRKRTRC